VWGHSLKEKSNSVLKNDGCTYYSHDHSFLILLTYLDIGYSLSLVLGNWYHMLRKIASYLFCSKVVSMAEPNKSTMKCAI